MQKITRLSSLPMKSLALAGVLAFGSSGAWASASCTLTPSSPNHTFTINNLLDVTTPDLEVPVSFNIDCTKNNIAANGRFCLRIGQGTAGTPAGTIYNDRWLQAGSNYAGVQVYKDSSYSTVWGPNTSGVASQITYALSGMSILASTYTIPASKITPSNPIYLKLRETFPTVAGVSSIKMLPPGIYSSIFNDSNTSWRMGFGLGVNADCSGGTIENTGNQPFTFTVTADIKAQCKITATTADIDFSTQSASATNLQGATNLKVQCTNTTPYFIGLKPDNNDVNGAGAMLKGADQIAYQLRQAPGMSGAIWGNTATSAAVGNGVAGTGNGLVKDHPIYATVASADGAVGTYSDTVTVTVNY